LLTPHVFSLRRDGFIVGNVVWRKDSRFNPFLNLIYRYQKNVRLWYLVCQFRVKMRDRFVGSYKNLLHSLA
jgi:hypothetical protein